jgi:UDP-N-acetylmuramoyl-tripeptide--D-alanyl-D-alanine ligase
MARRTTLAVLILAIAILAGALAWLNREWLGEHMSWPGRSSNFAAQIHKIRGQAKWRAPSDFTPRLTRPLMLQSLALGCDNLVKNQRPEGNFNYEYDWVARQQSKDDNQVRQAGALWDIALCHQFAPNDQTRAALDKGLAFFFAHDKPAPYGGAMSVYPGQNSVDTGEVALLALTLIDYLSSDQALAPERRQELDGRLDGYLQFLKGMQLPAGNISYRIEPGLAERAPNGISYYDGETQLAFVKAVKYLHKTEYLPILQKALARTAPLYTVESWRKQLDSPDTKGFYQWGSMTFTEYADGGWEKAPVYADTTLALAWWQVHTHNILHKPANTAYAFEGLASAYHVARAQNDKKAAAQLAQVIDEGLYKLSAWQVGGPLASKNPFLAARPTTDPLALGGVMNQREKPPLRIDVTGHQMHALMLALQYVYPE